MGIIWTKKGIFKKTDYENEADFEKAVIEISPLLFGSTRHYLDVKRKIGTKGMFAGIPDGYLLDLSGDEPRLFVVENELEKHDPLRHIATQILQYSLSFDADQLAVKRLLLEEISRQPAIKEACEKYIREHDEFRNLDHLCEHLVFDSPFGALIIIDDIPEGLESQLMQKFSFGVEVIALSRYVNTAGEKAFAFEPFLADVEVDEKSKPIKGKKTKINISDLDTIVVPAREDGFKETFIKQNRWYAIRIHGTMRPQIKYIAAYRIDPVSAITHIAPVKAIEPWRDTNKYVVKFAEPAREIRHIPLVKGRGVKGKAPQAPRYTSRDKIESAKTLDDLW